MNTDKVSTSVERSYPHCGDMYRLANHGRSHLVTLRWKNVGTVSCRQRELRGAVSGCLPRRHNDAGFRHPGTYPKKTRWVFWGTPT